MCDGWINESVTLSLIVLNLRIHHYLSVYLYQLLQYTSDAIVGTGPDKHVITASSYTKSCKVQHPA